MDCLRDEKGIVHDADLHIVIVWERNVLYHCMYRRLFIISPSSYDFFSRQ